MNMKASDLKALREKLGLTQQEFAAKAGVSLRSLQNWEAGLNEMSKGTQELIKKAFKDPDPTEVKGVKNHDGKGMPVLAGVYTTGSITTLFKDEHNEKPLFYLDAPEIKGCDYGVRVSGSSMYPLIPNGSYVACKSIQNKDYILYGEIYHVVTNDYSTIKYVHPHPTKEDWVVLVPYSDSAQSTSIPKTEILKIAQVRAILQVI